jgi:3'-5' exoribonuclease
VRRFVQQLTHKEAVDQVFLAGNKQLRSNRNGNLYLQLNLSDRTGSINGMMWNANEQAYKNFENGDYVKVAGTAQLYQGEMQLIVTNIVQADRADVCEEDFVRVSSRAVADLTARLGEIVRTIADPHLRALADCFLIDEALMARFTSAPAAVKNHHAYRGGLVEHVVSMMEVVLRIADWYPQLDRDLLLTGALWHDVGKIDELAYDRDFSYTNEGQLIGHIVMGVGLLDAKIAECQRLSDEEFPAELAMQIKHLIVSHHGAYEFGSPKLPMTLEAVVLSHVDDLDAKIHSFEQLMRDDPNVDSAFTPYIPNLGRKLYKGNGASQPGEIVETVGEA